MPALRAVAAAATVVGVVTQPDRPAGRGRRVAAPPVAAEAKALGLPLLQPESLRPAAVRDALAACRPDILAVVAYGLLVPEPVLALARLGGINVHPSLLPAYRGASPIQAAVAAGDRVTGVTVMHLTRDLDAGDIILQREVAIGPDETAGELEARLALVGADLLVEALDLLARGAAPRRPQDHSRATYAPKVTKADGRIDWRRPARAIVNHVRAMHPWPCAFTTWSGGVLRVWRAAEAGPAAANAAPPAAPVVPGTVLASGEDGIVVAAGEGTVRLVEVQPAGGRRMPAAAFARGHRLRPGDRLGPEVDSLGTPGSSTVE